MLFSLQFPPFGTKCLYAYMYRLLYATFAFIQCCLIQTTLSVVTQELMGRLNKKIKTLVKIFYAI